MTDTTDHPSRRAGLRDELRRAVCEAEGFAWDSDMLEPDEYGDHADTVLAVLYREWPWLRAEAEDAAAVSVPAADRAALSARLWKTAEQRIVAEWICCEPVQPGHKLCAKGYAALGMVKLLLVDADGVSAPLLDAVLGMLAPADRAALRDRIAEARPTAAPTTPVTVTEYGFQAAGEPLVYSIGATTHAAAEEAATGHGMRLVQRTVTTTPWKDSTTAGAATSEREEPRQRIAAVLREHYLCTNRAEADADGNMPCRCGDWREPGAEEDDENDWDAHLADVALSVLPAPADRAAEELAKHVTRAIFALKSPAPPGSAHYRAGWDDGLEAAMDAARDAVVDRVAAETPPAETERCVHCGQPVRRITGTLAAWWVHVPGGNTVCHPQHAAASTRATPGPAVEAQPGKDTETPQPKEA